MQRISRVVAGLGALALATGALLAGTPVAPAAAAPANSLTWESPSVEAQFGENWWAQIMYTAEPSNTFFGYSCLNGCGASARLEGPVAFDFITTFYTREVSAMTATATLSPLWATNLPGVLTPGSYTLTVTFAPPGSSAPAVSTALPVTIDPAELTFTLTTQEDPAVPEALIVSALLTRDFEDGYVGVTPGGTWILRAVDESGAEVLSRELVVGTDDSRLWGSTYWADPPPGEKITLTVSASGAAAEYSVADATTTLTTAEAPAPPPTPEPTPAPDEVATLNAAAVPTWVLLGAGLAFLAAIVAIVVVLVRRRRRPAVPTEPSDDTDSPGADAAANEGSTR